MRQTTLIKTAILMAMGMCGTVAAQEASPAQSYTPDYFTQFQPNTARDMVSRLPGFTLQGGGGGARGFGQANLNILINGRRPSSKSSDAREILGRIPANTVERIEILDGASLDIPGLSGQVANIVTTAGKLSGNWEYEAQFEEGTEPQLLEGEISVSGSRGNLDYVASFKSRQLNFTEDGVEQFFDGDGTLFEDRREDIFLAGNRPGLSLNLTYTPKDNHIANLNLDGQLFNRRNGNRESFTAITPQGNTGQSLSDSGEDEYNYEVSGDYAFPLGQGTLKLIGLHRYENSDFNNSFQEFLINEAPTRSDFNALDIEGEYIGRGEYSWKSGTQHDWQLSWEGAFNYLDSTTEFSSTTDPLSIDNVRVEEQRTEGNLTHSWKVSDKLNLQTSLGAEYSQLEVTTDNSPARKFFRPKGFISASYDYSPRYTWRAKFERDVGQLNFGTFVSSVNLSEDITNSGNNNIVPTQFWNGEIELERQDSKAVSGTVRLFARYIEDPVDRILFDDGSEGPGNLDSAWLYGIEANSTWIMDGIGLKGMRLELEGGLRDSSIDDPVTGISRRINDTTIWDYEVNLTHDIPNTPWAWNLFLEQDRESPFFRLDQSFNGRGTKPFSGFTVTHKDVFGMKVSLGLRNLFNYAIERPRIIYDGDRNGAIIETQNFSRIRGRRLSLKISDTF